MAQNNNIPYEELILRRNNETWKRTSLPPGWAQHRTQMISAVRWFNNHQGGIHTMSATDPDPVTIGGLLMGAHTGERSYVDAEIVITSINGPEEPDSTAARHRRKAMRNTIDAGNRAIGVIFEAGSVTPGSATNVGDKRKVDTRDFQVVPVTDMPQNRKDDDRFRQSCWLADFFVPTHMWPVKIPDKADGAVWMVRLEKCDLEKHSWWANPLHYPPGNDQRNFAITINTETCSDCGQQSPRIFRENFVCTDYDCPAVWRINGQIITSDVRLTYTDEFLQARSRRSVDEIVYPAGCKQLVPDFNVWYDENYLPFTQRNTDWTAGELQAHIKNLLMGFRCPICRMLNPRISWKEWFCRNKKCHGGASFRVNAPPPIVPLDKNILPVGPKTKPKPVTDWRSHRKFKQMISSTNFTAYEFEIGEGAYVAYLKPKIADGDAQKLSNRLYQKVQEQAKAGLIPLARRVLHTRAGETLTNHFAVNYGESYYFGARVETISFEDAPEVMRTALNAVNNWVAPWRKEGVDLPANELYLAGYWQNQEMNWHDDGEYGLQEVITTYTLGGQGNFRVRMKPRIMNGKIPRGSKETTIDPVPVGCRQEKERKALKKRFETKEITQTQWAEELTKVMAKGKKADSSAILELPVEHGELVIMYGPNTQRYYDHSVEVKTPMRFALTFRHIIREEHRRKLGKETEESYKQKLAYDYEYTPPDDWTEPTFMSPVGSRDQSPQSLPAASPRDDPITKRARLDSDDSDDLDDDSDVSVRRFDEPKSLPTGRPGNHTTTVVAAAAAAAAAAAVAAPSAISQQQNAPPAHGTATRARGGTSRARGSTSRARGSTSRARGSTSQARGDASTARGNRPVANPRSRRGRRQTGRGGETATTTSGQPSSNVADDGSNAAATGDVEMTDAAAPSNRASASNDPGGAGPRRSRRLAGMRSQ